MEFVEFVSSAFNEKNMSLGCSTFYLEPSWHSNRYSYPPDITVNKYQEGGRMWNLHSGAGTLWK